MKKKYAALLICTFALTTSAAALGAVNVLAAENTAEAPLIPGFSQAPNSNSQQMPDFSDKSGTGKNFKPHGPRKHHKNRPMTGQNSDNHSQRPDDNRSDATDKSDPSSDSNNSSTPGPNSGSGKSADTSKSTAESIVEEAEAAPASASAAADTNTTSSVSKH